MKFIASPTSAPPNTISCPFVSLSLCLHLKFLSFSFRVVPFILLSFQFCELHSFIVRWWWSPLEVCITFIQFLLSLFSQCLSISQCLSVSVSIEGCWRLSCLKKGVIVSNVHPVQVCYFRSVQVRALTWAEVFFFCVWWETEFVFRLITYETAFTLRFKEQDVIFYGTEYEFRFTKSWNRLHKPFRKNLKHKHEMEYEFRFTILWNEIRIPFRTKL